MHSACSLVRGGTFKSVPSAAVERGDWVVAQDKTDRLATGISQLALSNETGAYRRGWVHAADCALGVWERAVRDVWVSIGLIALCN